MEHKPKEFVKRAMKIDIIIVYIQRYRKGHEVHFVPPLTGIHLAALTPAKHTVRVIHQQVETVNLDSEADVIVLSFFSGFAPEAYRLAGEYRKRGKITIAGGPHVTFAPEEALGFVDSIVIGEGESVWEQIFQDIEQNRLQQRYVGEAIPLTNVPTPRYDLLPPQYFIRRVVQATRGCPFTCSFCTVPILNPGFRTRPVEAVLNDVRYNKFKWWWQRKTVWFWDDNLTANRPYIKELLRQMIPLRKWWLTQASMDITKDDELLDLMRDSGCIGIFFGIESFGQESLEDAGKRQNKVAEYQSKIKKLHDRGIGVMAGFISGLDGDTPESIRDMANQLEEIGVDVPFLSILTPFKGTRSYSKMMDADRLRSDLGWEFYNGYNVTFMPSKMTPAELLKAHRDLWRSAFSLPAIFRRISKSLFTLRGGAMMMCGIMNLFYGLKALTNNEPISFEGTDKYKSIRETTDLIPHSPQKVESM
ncbi:B12-binding domain-containing radical SAM protein [Synechocystis sp. LEGE 06083]|uniref:B12-binding domain-containing radical SAM protein n=1 Tax=Synechocystis sp. LEGE 06083 TaxID=915336 RepID=UPI00187E97E6|nr:radical SAM protein [Synechocystis sp. LEGE 06083]MBE9195905.1 B12-binding domain-containing radical SAM protein [Synechocystis sp. LEGE 06083]